MIGRLGGLLGRLMRWAGNELVIRLRAPRRECPCGCGKPEIRVRIRE